MFPWTLSSQRNQKRKRVYLFAYDFNASEWLKMTPEVCEDECEHNPQMFCYGARGRVAFRSQPLFAALADRDAAFKAAPARFRPEIRGKAAFQSFLKTRRKLEIA